MHANPNRDGWGASLQMMMLHLVGLMAWAAQSVVGDVLAGGDSEVVTKR